MQRNNYSTKHSISLENLEPSNILWSTPLELEETKLSCWLLGIEEIIRWSTTSRSSWSIQHQTRSSWSESTSCQQHSWPIPRSLHPSGMKREKHSMFTIGSFETLLRYQVSVTLSNLHSWQIAQHNPSSLHWTRLRPTRPLCEESRSTGITKSFVECSCMETTMRLQRLP